MGSSNDSEDNVYDCAESNQEEALRLGSATLQIAPQLIYSRGSAAWFFQRLGKSKQSCTCLECLRKSQRQFRPSTKRRTVGNNAQSQQNEQELSESSSGTQGSTKEAADTTICVSLLPVLASDGGQCGSETFKCDTRLKMVCEKLIPDDVKWQHPQCSGQGTSGRKP